MIYLVTFLILNLIIILNLVIAILATTYEEYSGYKRGLYYDTLVRTVPRLQSHKHYGAIVCALGPLNGLVVVISPLYFIVRDPAWLKAINKGLCFVFYLPNALVVIVLWVALNIVLIPFA